MPSRDFFRIKTNTLIRDEMMERRLIEGRRERFALWIMLAGSVLILYGIMM